VGERGGVLVESIWGKRKSGERKEGWQRDFDMTMTINSQYAKQEIIC
jgi:hypothetical protein